MTRRRARRRQTGEAPQDPALAGRPSPCAESSAAEESARIRGMTPLERMELAFALGRRRLDLLASQIGNGQERDP